ncbi:MULTISPECIES: nucleoside transporter C-terminal domain-containing protein [Moorena]|uniref:Nucleoside permease n=1 Tax=Moorena producens 3L TaxID=489825 RepID=F4XX30_9CYAN|nr:MULTISPECIES: nucleoside transporter C-terminal domain-containing protein [Moorena]EGJ30915.1 nucleoside permease [Moorena producens 3L]NEP64876.1 nucleoside:proton symporter [Moorena sp. SIO3A5]NES42634.1 nucleoside:proton symporter [Moorena sp. SIO2C4]OLT66770.1 nucleoside:proton symporter [Moorena producens 3L]
MSHPLYLNLISFCGIFALCFIAWLSSEHRRLIPWKVIIFGIGLQLVMGLLIFLFAPTRQFILGLNDALNAILDASEAGARFMLGGGNSAFVPDPELMVGPGPAGRWIYRAVGTPYVSVPGDRLTPDNLNFGFIFAFRSLPQVVFFSALIALLYRLGVIQPVVQVFARLFRATMSISGAESLSGAANIFVGIESAIAVKPFLADMTRSELCAILTCCFGSIASTVLALYTSFLRPTFPTITGHLMSASVLTIPACFVMAKLIVPETDVPKTLGKVPTEEEDPNQKKPSLIDSLIVGASDGVRMAVGIAAVVIAILGLVALVNTFFAYLANLTASDNPLLQLIGNIFSVITLDNIFGVLFLPLTFLTGISLNWQELWQASVLIGQRLLQTEIPSYLKLAQLSAQGLISDRAILIISYVLCGFAHIASFGIFVGGLASLVPERRADISAIGWKALWAATLATYMTGCIAGVFDFGNPAILGK